MKETLVKKHQLVMMKLTESKSFTDKNTTQEITAKQVMPSNISIRTTIQVFVVLLPPLFS